jgi:hypothetical protein
LEEEEEEEERREAAVLVDWALEEAATLSSPRKASHATPSTFLT